MIASDRRLRETESELRLHNFSRSSQSLHFHYPLKSLVPPASLPGFLFVRYNSLFPYITFHGIHLWCKWINDSLNESARTLCLSSIISLILSFAVSYSLNWFVSMCNWLFTHTRFFSILQPLFTQPHVSCHLIALHFTCRLFFDWNCLFVIWWHQIGASWIDNSFVSISISHWVFISCTKMLLSKGSSFNRCSFLAHNSLIEWEAPLINSSLVVLSKYWTKFSNFVQLTRVNG